MMIKRHKIFWMLAGISLALLLSASAFGYARLHDVDLPLIVHFDIFNGLNVHGSAADIFSIIKLGSFFFFIDLFLAYALLRRDEFLAHLMLSVSFLLNLFILMSVVGIIHFNF